MSSSYLKKWEIKKGRQTERVLSYEKEMLKVAKWGEKVNILLSDLQKLLNCN